VKWGVAGDGRWWIRRCKKRDREGQAGGTRTRLIDSKECTSVGRKSPSMASMCAELGPPWMSFRRPMRVEDVSSEFMMEKMTDNLGELREAGVSP